MNDPTKIDAKTLKMIADALAHGEGYHQAMTAVEQKIQNMRNENKSDTEIVEGVLSMIRNMKNTLE